MGMLGSRKTSDEAGDAMDLRTTIKMLDELGELKRIEKPVRTVFDVARFMKQFDSGPALLFETIEGFESKVVSGTCPTKKRVASLMHIPEGILYETITHSIAHPVAPDIKGDGPVTEIKAEPKLTRLPILKHYEKDPAPYLTSAIVSARSADQKIENVSMHRMMVLDDRHVAIRIVPRHLYRLCELAKRDARKTLDVAISLGHHPSVLIAASSPAPFGVSEYGVANALMGGRLSLIQCTKVTATAPADSEIVLEGKILLDKEVDEGPFVDLTGTYDVVRKQPVVEIVGMMHRREFLFQGLLPAGAEHKLLMGLPYEARIWNAVRATLPGLKRVSLTSGGGGWLHAIVSIHKQSEGDGKAAILATFGAHPSLKHVVVVDEDIDVDNPLDVEWAIATRFRADKGLVVVDNIRSSSLDPSSDQNSQIGAKMGLDATRSFSKSKDKFEKARIPERG
jgi:UbiD family decarboxylase